MRLAVLFSIFALTAACSAGEPVQARHQPVIGGEKDIDDTNVVAVLLQTASGELAGMCTGSLISPRVVMTAAHCVDLESGAIRWDIYFGALASGGDIHFIDQIGTVDHVVHPRWKNAELTAGNDVALLLMARPAPPGITPIPINHTPLESRIGAPVRLVGYGNLVAEIGAGQKRTGTTMLTSVTGNLVFYGNEDVNTCQGDSGGPELMDLGEGEVVVGITSFGPIGCKEYGAGTRVDAFAAPFIDPWVAAKDAPGCEPGGACVAGCVPHDADCAPRGDGEPCTASSECAGGICLPAPDDPDVSYCTGECSGASCPAGMECVAASGTSVCAWPTPTPRAPGAACAADTACASNLCLPILGERRCTSFCDDGFGGCRAGFQCVLYGDDHVCAIVPPREGGCSVVPGARRGLAPAALLVLLAGYFFFLSRNSLR